VGPHVLAEMVDIKERTTGNKIIGNVFDGKRKWQRQQARQSAGGVHACISQAPQAECAASRADAMLSVGKGVDESILSLRHGWWLQI
jgi:hypothetical protein